MSDIKQVIVMRTDLGMRKGKMVAQGAHAAMMFLTKGLYIWDPDGRGTDAGIRGLKLDDVQREWVEGIFKKIVVGVDSEEGLMRVYARAHAEDLVVHLCTDNGLTEFAGVPTKTCIAIGPDFADRIDPITKDLRLI